MLVGWQAAGNAGAGHTTTRLSAWPNGVTATHLLALVRPQHAQQLLLLGGRHAAAGLAARLALRTQAGLHATGAAARSRCHLQLLQQLELLGGSGVLLGHLAEARLLREKGGGRRRRGQGAAVS